LSKLAVAGVVVAGLFVIGSFSGGGDSDSSGDSYMAEEQCKDWVKEQLKAPSTAEFENVSSTGSDPYTVTGDVDAQNGFGAQIRTTWTCDIHTEGDYWKGHATLLE
jgi:hypothetical protein